MMNTRLTTRATALLAAVLLAQAAAGMEEVVVVGTDLSAPKRTVTERLNDSMSDYVKAINEAQKSRLNADLAKPGRRRIQIAAAALPTSG